MEWLARKRPETAAELLEAAVAKLADQAPEVVEGHWRFEAIVEDGRLRRLRVTEMTRARVRTYGRRHLDIR
jgi:hypothetical protein